MSNESCSLGGNGSGAGVEVEVRKPAHSLTEEVEGGSGNSKPLKQFGLKGSETVADSHAGEGKNFSRGDRLWSLSNTDG